MYAETMYGSFHRAVDSNPPFVLARAHHTKLCCRQLHGCPLDVLLCVCLGACHQLLPCPIFLIFFRIYEHLHPLLPIPFATVPKGV